MPCKFIHPLLQSLSLSHIAAVIVITFMSAQSDPIKKRPLYMRISLCAVFQVKNLKRVFTWQMSFVHLQIVALQLPAPGDVVDWKYVKFSAILLPHPKVTEKFLRN
jgi:hypothetical protein